MLQEKLKGRAALRLTGKIRYFRSLVVRYERRAETIQAWYTSGVPSSSEEFTRWILVILLIAGVLFGGIQPFGADQAESLKIARL